MLIGPTYVLLSALGKKPCQTLFCSIDYAKKKEKRAQIKFLKDETVLRDDQYKSHTVHVPTGEPPNSKSRPPAKRKPGVVRPITSGKLLKKGGPSKVCEIYNITTFAL